MRVEFFWARAHTHTHRLFLFAINTGVWLCVDDVAQDVSPVPVLNCELLESPELHTEHQLLSPSWWEIFFLFFKLKQNAPFKPFFFQKMNAPPRSNLQCWLFFSHHLVVTTSHQPRKKKTLWKFQHIQVVISRGRSSSLCGSGKGGDDK